MSYEIKMASHLAFLLRDMSYEMRVASHLAVLWVFAGAILQDADKLGRGGAGNSGLGVETVRVLAHAGAYVLLTAKSKEDGLRTIQMLEADGMPVMMFMFCWIDDQNKTYCLYNVDRPPPILKRQDVWNIARYGSEGG